MVTGHNLPFFLGYDDAVAVLPLVTAGEPFSQPVGYANQHLPIASNVEALLDIALLL